MNTANSDYGMWSLVLINSAFFIFFAASFFKPQSRQDWRTLGLFPILVATYVRLARREERQAIEVFGEAYRRYMQATPAWWPRWCGAPVDSTH
jgi:protein-S-isoprenylcysteine O-methyltransferase Ste14